MQQNSLLRQGYYGLGPERYKTSSVEGNGWFLHKSISPFQYTYKTKMAFWQ